jgi:heme exporter protein C
MTGYSPLPLALLLFGSLCLAACQWLIYCYAPVEASMGQTQKIFYIHLPLAWWALLSFFLVFLGSVAYLLKRAPGADSLCAAAAEIGVLLSGLALLTGMLWARKSWGVWWTWDPRLTTTLIMWFVYAGYLALRGLDMSARRKGLVCAVVGIVAFLDVPLVFISARIWRSIHPAVLGAQDGGLEPEMKLVAAACVAAFGFFWTGLVWLRKRQIDQRARLDALSGLQADENNAL